MPTRISPKPEFLFSFDDGISFTPQSLFKKSPKTLNDFLKASIDLLTNPMAFISNLVDFTNKTIRHFPGQVLDEDQKNFFETAASILAQNGYIRLSCMICLELLHDYELLSMYQDQITIQPDTYTKADILYRLEKFDAASSLIDAYNREHIPIGEFTTDWTTPSGGIWGDFDFRVGEVLKTYYKEWGYDEDKVPGYSLLQSAKNLVALSDQFDLFVPVAKAGLFLGGVAKMLGLDVRAIEVHARDRNQPEITELDPLRPENVRGKRVLILENDVKTGVTLKATADYLKTLGPAKLETYLAIPPPDENRTRLAEQMYYSNVDGVKAIEASGMRLHHSHNMFGAPFLEAYYRVNEALHTQVGRLIRAERETTRILSGASPLSPSEIDKIKTSFDLMKQIFDAFNPLAAETVFFRNALLKRVESTISNFNTQSGFDSRMAWEALLSMSAYFSVIPDYVAEDIAHHRYHPRIIAASKRHGVDYQGRPHSYSTAFRLAQEVLSENYDVAVIVGPEGFGYQPIFEELGLTTLAVNIPESNYAGDRSFVAFDDLSQIEGKNVLVVEDDVQSGATLHRLRHELAQKHPSSMGLYLGLPPPFQKMENIPHSFKKIHVTEYSQTHDERNFLNFIQKRSPLFKKKALTARTKKLLSASGFSFVNTAKSASKIRSK